jgi:predicted dithiol-disulfide oxidoreductase (DUF899 family)
MIDEISAPPVVERATYQAAVDALLIREKAHTREGDAIGAARRRLPMVRIDGSTPLTGDKGQTTLLEAFEGRRILLAYYFMWHEGRPAPEQCEGCTFFTNQVRDLTCLHARDITYATIAQGPWQESSRYRTFMGWEMPWYAASKPSLQTLLDGRRINMMHLIAYLRQDDEVFETYWTWRRGVEVMDNCYHLADLTVYGRQEQWEDSPEGWPQSLDDGKNPMRERDRPIAQWARLAAGRSDDLS